MLIKGSNEQEIYPSGVFMTTSVKLHKAEVTKNMRKTHINIVLETDKVSSI